MSLHKWWSCKLPVTKLKGLKNSEHQNPPTRSPYNQSFCRVQRSGVNNEFWVCLCCKSGCKKKTWSWLSLEWAALVILLLPSCPLQLCQRVPEFPPKAPRHTKWDVHDKIQKCLGSLVGNVNFCSLDKITVHSGMRKACKVVRIWGESVGYFVSTQVYAFGNTALLVWVVNILLCMEQSKPENTETELWPSVCGKYYARMER